MENSWNVPIFKSKIYKKNQNKKKKNKKCDSFLNTMYSFINLEFM